MTDRNAAIAQSYDRLASRYADKFFDELRHKPLDRALLGAFADLVGPDAPVADIGCGPGQVARDLQARGLRVIGIDLSPEMISVALSLTPGIDFRVGSMKQLDLPDGSLAGITAFYAIVHLEPYQLVVVFRELHRVLRPGGIMLLAFHVGRERVKRDEMFGERIDLEFVFFDRKVVEVALEQAGFTVDVRIERAPYAEVEDPSVRGYLRAPREVIIDRDPWIESRRMAGAPRKTAQTSRPIPARPGSFRHDSRSLQQTAPGLARL